MQSTIFEASRARDVSSKPDSAVRIDRRELTPRELAAVARNSTRGWSGVLPPSGDRLTLAPAITGFQRRAGLPDSGQTDQHGPGVRPEALCLEDVT